MNTKEVLQAFEELVDIYVSELDRYTIEQFTHTPGEGQWSLGQMYNHLINAAFFMQLKAIERCAADPSATGGEKTEIGEKVIAAGNLPPVKIKVPDSPEYTPTTPESTEEVKVRLQLLTAKMREIEPSVAGIPRDRKVPHPAFGYLSAIEWFQLVPMHFRHHLRQKHELDDFLVSIKKS